VVDVEVTCGPVSRLLLVLDGRGLNDIRTHRRAEEEEGWKKLFPPVAGAAGSVE